MNPSCNTSIFQLFSSGKINSIEELAHVIGKSSKGPRGSSKLTDRDRYENIIILCPNCHTTIDKNSDEYPKEVIYKWKEEHVRRIDSIFEIKKYEKKELLREKFAGYLEENKKIFDSYGPHSSIAKEKPYSDSADQWEKLSIEKIIPNNLSLIHI